MDDSSDLDTHRVAVILQSQFPAMRPKVVTWLGEGYDSMAFEVNHQWVFRFPKRRDVEAQLLVEMRILPILSGESPLALPNFAFAGTPSDLFPRHFGGYPKIPGTPAIRLDSPTAWHEGLAASFGNFLSWLHAYPPAEAARRGVVTREIGAVIDEARTDSLGDFENLRHVAPHAPLHDWRNFLESAPSQEGEYFPERVLVHGDLATEHVLYDSAADSIVGVIDWSEISIADASLDFAALFHWGGQALATAVLAHYAGEANELMLSRARYLAACRGVLDVTFGLETGRAEYVAAGLQALRLCIPAFDEPIHNVSR